MTALKQCRHEAAWASSIPWQRRCDCCDWCGTWLDAWMQSQGKPARFLDCPMSVWKPP